LFTHSLTFRVVTLRTTPTLPRYTVVTVYCPVTVAICYFCDTFTGYTYHHAFLILHARLLRSPPTTLVTPTHLVLRFFHTRYVGYPHVHAFSLIDGSPGFYARFRYERYVWIHTFFTRCLVLTHTARTVTRCSSTDAGCRYRVADLLPHHVCTTFAVAFCYCCLHGSTVCLILWYVRIPHVVVPVTTTLPVVIPFDLVPGLPLLPGFKRPSPLPDHHTHVCHAGWVPVCNLHYV